MEITRFKINQSRQLWLYILLLMAVPTISFSQSQFEFKATLGKADSSGFYRLILPLDVVSRSRASLFDIRIINADNKETAYLLSSNDAQLQQELIPFSIISKAKGKDKKTHVLVKNPDRTITQLVLNVQNSYASRTVNINGSNDGKEWFVIRDKVMVSTSEFQTRGSYLFFVDLPASTVSYFDISFADKDLLPVNILQVGTYHRQVLPVSYDTVKTNRITQTDSSNHTSYASISWQEKYPVEQIKLTVEGPAYYRREILINPQSAAANRLLLQPGKNEWLPVRLQSKQTNLQILNDDNPPLQLLAATGLVKKYSLYAWLEKGQVYTLYFGDSLSRAPRYDLLYFKDLIQANAAPISLQSIEKNSKPGMARVVEHSNTLLIWIAIITALLILSFLTFKLTVELKKQKAI